MLYRERFTLLRELMRIRLMVEGHGDAPGAVYAHFVRNAEQLTPRHRKALVHGVDRIFSGVASRLEKEAELGKEEILLFCYSVMGLDAELIAMLLKLDNCNCVYTRKYRLKRKIRLRCGPRRNYYLSFLE